MQILPPPPVTQRGADEHGPSCFPFDGRAILAAVTNLHKKRHGRCSAILPICLLFPLALVLLLQPASAYSATPPKPAAPVLLGIPAIGLRAPVAHGDPAVAPDRVVAHFKGLAGVNTVVLGAHSWSLTQGALFARIGELRAGDTIFVATSDGRLYVYRVRDVTYLLPSEWSRAWAPEWRDGRRVPVLRLLTCAEAAGYVMVSAELG